MGLKGLLDNWKQKAAKHAAEVAVDQAKKRARNAAQDAKGAAQEAGKRLGDFLFGEEEEAPSTSEPKSREAVEASKKWEEAKARIEARERAEKASSEAKARIEREVDRDLEALKRKLGK
ncbi:hypothetical protein [Labilithrix luteola]|nr:hypothetical protein [Labilithrix luteola]